MHIRINGGRYPLLVVCLGLGLILAAAVLAACSGIPGITPKAIPPLPTRIQGRVLDSDGKPVSGAIIQIKGTPNQTTTASDGGFTISGQGLGGTTLATITAWSAGHFVGWVDLDPQKPTWQAGGTGVKITLKPLYTVDNNQYTWFTYEGVSGSASCAICHRESSEWSQDAHSQSANNVRFVTMYMGTNGKGQEGQLTRFGTNGQTLPPDPTQPYYGPGFSLDNPDRPGNCATCHTPLASTIPNVTNCAWSGCHLNITSVQAHAMGIMDIGVSPVNLSGIATEGVACEFCHKVADVTIDPKTNMPYPDRPGILSMKLARPPAGQNVFFGTIVDISRRVSYLPLETQSQFCAPCHYGVFGGVMGVGEVTGGTVIYNSYGEWLNSSYSDPKTGKTCQDCHMPTEPGTNFTVFPEKGGITRSYEAFHDHTMPGASDTLLLQNSVTMKSQASHNGDQLTVDVSITNDKTGHDVPTDSPMRSVMLIIQAVDANGKPLTLTLGPTLPAWTGGYSGQPGKAFAKILKDNWSGEMPTSAYWRPVTIVEDNRLAPWATDASSYTFTLPAGGSANVTVTLVYRRAFQQLEQQKGWNDPDIPMAETTIKVEK